MNEKIVYLDSSAIVKRYFYEPGTNILKNYYLKAYSGEIKLAYSIWNIGEVLGVFDRAKRLGRINQEEYSIAKKRFLGETKRMIKLNIALVIPIVIKVLKESWKLIEKHHIYIADALQIASAKYINSKEFLTGDKKLHKIANNEGLKSRLLT